MCVIFKFRRCVFQLQGVPYMCMYIQYKVRVCRLFYSIICLLTQPLAVPPLTQPPQFFHLIKCTQSKGTHMCIL